MVAIDLVRESNEQLRNLPRHLSSPTAVFTGATQGIGLATLRQLATYTVQPTCYIVGRSEAKTRLIIDELKEVNGKGTYIFVQGEVALVESVDECCQKIKGMIGEGKGLDMLCMSQGYISLGGREETKEGIDQILSLRYYSRLRFIENLLPLLSSSPDPRVVSVLAAGMENKIFEDDMDLKHNYGVIKCAHHGTTMTTLAFEHLAKENPTVAFVHVYPGFVKTEIQRNMFPWPFSTLYTYILEPLLSFIAITLSECGDRQLFHATSSRYPPKTPTQAQAGAPVPSKIAVADGSDGIRGSGCYIVGQTSDIAPSGTGKIMRDYRERGLPEKVWKHTVEIFDQVRG
ncbi:MAG: hypothetical protein Q9220_000698 [cf. Caloplaca sp. 1 TL-2023]